MSSNVDGFAPVISSHVDSGQSPLEFFIERWRDKGGDPIKAGRDWRGQCLSHDDHDPSLSIREGDDGRVLLKCHAGCSVEEICQALGIRTRDLFPRNGTHRSNGRPIPPRADAPEPMAGDKAPDPEPLWSEAELAEAVRRLAASSVRDCLISERCWSAEMIERYGLGFDPDGRVVIPVRDLAGELINVERYRALSDVKPKILALKDRPRGLLLPPEGVPAEVYLTEVFGDALAAQSHGVPAVACPSATWRDEFAATLARASVRTAHVVGDCDDAGRKFAAEAVASLTAHGIEARAIDLGADRPEKFDVSDLMREHGADAAGVLSELVRDTPSRLDELRSEARDLLELTIAFVARYVSLSDAQLIALALWVGHTHAFGAASATPYIMVQSPVRRCGKTALLEVLARLVRDSWHCASASESALFRRIEVDQPTLLLDEIDALFGSATERTEPLRAVLNSGNRPGASVARVVGTDFEVRDFNVFCPKCLAGIATGRLPDTIQDRSITIAMRRIGPGEKVERRSGARRRARFEQGAAVLRDRWAAWSRAAIEQLRAVEPDPDGDLEELDERAFDGWEPLLAIAEFAGDEWRKRSRAAALALSGGATTEERNTSTILLAALRDVLSEPQLASEDICQRLNGDERLPFGGWNDGHGITPRELAKQVKRYGIAPRTIRIGDATPRGYRRGDFTDAWRRYLDPQHTTAPQREIAREQREVADVLPVADFPDTPETTSPGIPNIANFLRNDRWSA